MMSRLVWFRDLLVSHAMNTSGLILRKQRLRALYMTIQLGAELWLKISCLHVLIALNAVATMRIEPHYTIIDFLDIVLSLAYSLSIPEMGSSSIV
jgi:hypothetical protein